MKVFLSSTYIDLKDYRKAAKEALSSLDLQVIWMEDFGALPEEPQAACLDRIEDCDIVIGLYAHRYGHVPNDSLTSITEQEYEHAKKMGKNIFCFLVAPSCPWNPELSEEGDQKQKLVKFKQTVKKEFVFAEFTTVEDLYSKVTSSIAKYLVKLEREKAGAKRKQLLLPTIVVSMNQEESSELQNRSVLEKHAGKEEAQKYEQFLEALDKEGCQNPFERYKGDRDLWEPPFGEGKTISELIESGLLKVNQNSAENEQTIIGYSITDEFFNGEVNKNEFVKIAKEEGCLIIIDAISLFHPLVRKRLHKSGLPSQSKSAVIFISPTVTNSNLVTRSIEELVSTEMDDVFERYDAKGEMLCEMNIGDLRSFQRWFFTAISVETQMAHNPNAHPENIKEFQNRLKITPKNIHRYFYSKDIEKQPALADGYKL
jgi:hypothetical protein